VVILQNYNCQRL